MGDAESLIASVAGVAPGVWSSEATELAKSAMSDTLAVGVAGAFSPQARVAAKTVFPASLPDACAQDGNALVAPLLTDDRLFAVPDAAFVLGTGIHSMDWDDFMHPMHGHCSVVLLGALLPLGEALDVDGTELLDAFLVGYQVDWLASLALSHAHYRRGWHATSTIGVLGAAAAACRLLGLDARDTGAALGIAASMASGIRANFGTTTKALHAGIAARSGNHAASLARAGATSSADWLLGPAGMVGTFGGEHTVTEAAREVTDGARSTVEHRPMHGIETAWGRVQKPYACCGSIHGAVDALLLLLERTNIAWQDIQEIVAHVDPIVLDIMKYERPDDENQARYSPTWVMAATAVDRVAGTSQFGRAALGRSDIHAFRERVRVVGDWETDDDSRFGGRVEIRTRDGRLEGHEVFESRGHPRRPLSPSELSAKVASAVGSVAGPDSVESTVEVVEGLAARPVRDTMRTLRKEVQNNCQLSTVGSTLELKTAGWSPTSVDIHRK